MRPARCLLLPGRHFHPRIEACAEQGCPEEIFFVKDSPQAPSTANHSPPPSANRQPPTAANCLTKPWHWAACNHNSLTRYFIPQFPDRQVRRERASRSAGQRRGCVRAPPVNARVGLLALQGLPHPRAHLPHIERGTALDSTEATDLFTDGGASNPNPRYPPFTPAPPPPFPPLARTMRLSERHKVLFPHLLVMGTPSSAPTAAHGEGGGRARPRGWAQAGVPRRHLSHSCGSFPSTSYTGGGGHRRVARRPASACPYATPCVHGVQDLNGLTCFRSFWNCGIARSHVLVVHEDQLWSVLWGWERPVGGAKTVPPQIR